MGVFDLIELLFDCLPEFDIIDVAEVAADEPNEEDEADARRIITALAGTTHELWTGVCLWHRPTDWQFCWQERSLVRMKALGGDPITKGDALDVLPKVTLGVTRVGKDQLFAAVPPLPGANPRDRATGWEVDIVNSFRNDAELMELVGQRDTPTGRSLYISRPLRITNPACLVCHSSVEAAPKTMVDSVTIMALA